MVLSKAKRVLDIPPPTRHVTSRRKYLLFYGYFSVWLVSILAGAEIYFSHSLILFLEILLRGKISLIIVVYEKCNHVTHEVLGPVWNKSPKSIFYTVDEAMFWILFVPAEFQIFMVKSRLP